jgi:GT2 family glycosyltransferase
VVSVVVVNWRAGERLTACLASLDAEHAAGTEVVVVDNASPDDSTRAATTERPWVRVVWAEENAGFAAGANRGAAQATGEVVVFLNPDARPEPGAVATLCGALAARADAGVAGGALRDEAGRAEAGWARFGPVAHPLLDTTPGRALRRGTPAPRVVDWVYGTFMAVKRPVFDALGGFDPAYFLYGEDMDLCHRARAAGRRVLYVPAARAVHGPNVSAVHRYGHGREAAVVRGEIRFYRRRVGRGAALVFRTLAGAKSTVRATAAALRGRRAAAARHAATLRACWSPDA